MSQPDTVAIFRARMQELRSAVGKGPRTFQNFLRELMLRHMEKVSSQYLGHPAYAASTPVWTAMLDESVLDVTSRSIETLFLGKAFREGVHAWETHRLANMFLIASAIPAVSAEDVKAFFPDGYLPFFEGEGFLMEATRSSLVHWIVCSDGHVGVAHLHCLPFDHSAIALVPNDILTIEERVNIGMI